MRCLVLCWIACIAGKRKKNENKKRQKKNKSKKRKKEEKNEKEKKSEG